MKKVMIVIAILLGITVHGFTFDLFGLGGIKTDVRTLKDSTEKNWSDIKAGVNDVKAGINDVNNKQIAIGNEIGVLKNNSLKLSAKLEAVISANVKPNIGYQTGNTDLQAGGNLTQSNKTKTVNDTGLMKAMLSAMGTIVAGLLLFIRLQSTQLARLNEQNMKYSKERDDKYYKMMEDQQEHYQSLVKSKQDYKNRYFDILRKADVKLTNLDIKTDKHVK